jgi:hypothetical protein
MGSNTSLIGTTIIDAGTPPPPPPKAMKAVYNPPNSMEGLQGIDAYISYPNLLVNDGTGIQDLTNNAWICVNKCKSNPNCRGLNIIQNIPQEEVTTDGYNYEQSPNIACEYVSNISYSNSRVENENSTFYAKKNNLAFENNTPYLLNTGNECLSLQKKKDGTLDFKSTFCNDYDKLTPVYFNTASDTIKIGQEGNNCLKYYNDSGMDQNNLQKCNDYDNSQKFIYDHVLKSLRPFNDTTKCLWRDANGLYVFADCILPNANNNMSKTTTFENYYKPEKDDYVEYFQQDYTVDLRYYILYMILLLMILYLMVVSSKK